MGKTIEIEIDVIEATSTPPVVPEGLPVPDASKSYWIEETDSPIKGYRSAAGVPSEADVVIIGSGYTGTSVAANILLEHWSRKSVVMLEARDVCSGATGRNGGHVRSFYHHHHQHYAELYGEAAAADLIIFEDAEMAKVKKLVEKYKIDCYYEERQSCQVFASLDQAKQDLADYYSFIKNPYLPQSIKSKVKVFFGQQAKDVSFTDTVAVCSMTPTASVWPYRLITGLIEKCIGKGLNLQTNTPVSELRQKGQKWLVRTSRGTILAKKVVIATNAYTKSLLPEFKGKILPVKGCVSHMKPIDPLTPRLPFNYYHTYPMEGDYVTARHDNSIIAGGGGATYLGFPNSLAMINTVDDSQVPQATRKYFEGYPSRNYTCFANKPFVNDYTWTGVMGYTDDEFPFVGDLAPYGRANMYISAGYTGHGMPRIWSCGAYIADLIAGRYRKTHIPHMFALSPERMWQGRVSYLEDAAEVDPRNKILAKL